MERLTEKNLIREETMKENEPIETPRGTAIRLKLTAYENFHEDLLNRKMQIPLEMKALKDQGKEKSYRYRELMGEKLMAENTLGILGRYLD